MGLEEFYHGWKVNENPAGNFGLDRVRELVEQSNTHLTMVDAGPVAGRSIGPGFNESNEGLTKIIKIIGIKIVVDLSGLESHSRQKDVVMHSYVWPHVTHDHWHVYLVTAIGKIPHITDAGVLGIP